MWGNQGTEIPPSLHRIVGTPRRAESTANSPIEIPDKPHLHNHRTRLRKMVSESTGLKVIVVGAGIAGLAAARALREKHHVTIFESSRMKNEVGAAIHMGPNASRILLGWGLSPKRVGSVYCYGVLERTYQNITQVDMETDSEKAFGSPWLLNHRADLHEELRRIALDPAGPGQVPELRLGSTVESCDPDAGTVTLADGSVVHGDVIIGNSESQR
jgi:salicylate hydroxylase